MLLCPRDSPVKNTGVGCHFLLQGIFPTQGSNPMSPALAGGLFTTEPAGKPQKEALCLQEIKQNVRGLFLGIFLPFFSADLLPLRIRKLGTSLVVQLLRLCAPNAGSQGSTPARGTSSHMPQLKILQATTKTRHSQINKNILKVIKLCIFTASQNHSQAQVRPKAQALFDAGMQWKKGHHFEFI